jgi:hypothetical protein
MFRIVIALVLLAHGIGHSMGPLQVFKVATVNPLWDGDSWILGRVVGPTAAQGLGVVLWAVALVGFVVAAAVFVGWLPMGWWQPVAVGSAVVSLIGLVLFPAAFPVFSTIGAAAVDAAVLVAVLGFHWLPDSAVI